MKYKTISFEELEKYIIDNNIPKNVALVSDSGWECDATGIRAVYYSKEENILYLYQDSENWKIGTPFEDEKENEYKINATQLKEREY